MTAEPRTPAVCPRPAAVSVPATSRASRPPTVIPTVTPSPPRATAPPSTPRVRRCTSAGSWPVRTSEAIAGSGLQPHGAADDLLHDLVGAAVDGLHARVAGTPWRRGTRACSRSRRAAAGSGRRPASAARSSTTWPSRRPTAVSSPASCCTDALVDERPGDRRARSPSRPARSGCSGRRRPACRTPCAPCTYSQGRAPGPPRRAATAPTAIDSRSCGRFSIRCDEAAALRAEQVRRPAPGRRRRTARRCPAPSGRSSPGCRPRSKPGMPRSTTSRLKPAGPGRPGRSGRRRSPGRR